MSLYLDELRSIRVLVIRLHREMHNPGYIANTCERWNVETEYERAIDLLESAIEKTEAMMLP